MTIRLNLKNKIKSPSQLAKITQALRKKGKCVVFTNGCFDILHPGHVTYLQEARNKGDVLVIAVDTDASVRKLKGPDRPVNALKSRMTVLAALESVGYVTWFSGGNPIPTIKAINPKVLVKGGDWKIDQILGSKEVLRSGGKVYSLPFVAGKSTTRVIEKIRRSKCKS